VHTSGSPDPNLRAQDRFARVLGTRLCLTTYVDFSDRCHALAREPGPVAVEFTNTQIVTLRRHDPAYRQLTAAYDLFVPDATPLIWCLNRRGAGLKDRVYGPTFMRHCLTHSPAETRHYLLGGSRECGERLRAAARGWNPRVNIIGSAHDRCLADGRLEGEAEARVMRELHDLSPDFIWVGLGTPKQDAWVQRHKPRLDRGLILSVGFAFDVNAGTKPDAPGWMQRAGLTWLFRMGSEPRRLFGRYLKYNTLFLLYLAWDGAHGPVEF
jgi:N-acetylglucosaminyldiphosphoundecaprenol N-acetyl-beta-D-mannosaminyltransferase